MDFNNLDDLWEALLSEEPALIRTAWLDLTDEEAEAVAAHLRNMAEAEGWADLQRQAAATALRVIRELSG